MEFHVNQQRINVPISLESLQVTDLGTNVRLAMTGTSLFSMRGNFTRDFPGRNNHIILRYDYILYIYCVQFAYLCARFCNICLKIIEIS